MTELKPSWDKLRTDINPDIHIGLAEQNRIPKHPDLGLFGALFMSATSLVKLTHDGVRLNSAYGWQLAIGALLLVEAWKKSRPSAATHLISALAWAALYAVAGVMLIVD